MPMGAHHHRRRERRRLILSRKEWSESAGELGMCFTEGQLLLLVAMAFFVVWFGWLVFVEPHPGDSDLGNAPTFDFPR
jgi:hypothetical protein